ncbi:hypothetical protein [Streptomyces turgidiscabies]|uniref:Uncharacterized protein n=1 Tax=Streptomyces turgidiscabies TaxID=85558 RepID=A0ABU0RSU3_9ACTN|nr:hypothetical protein [Streptomyces turgidiscabies]MDQ0935064.1 hypothetical protein [Streptomyces turgidiscabies]
MTVHIAPLGAAILVLGVLAGLIVYRHTQTTSGPASKGDIVGAIGAGVAVITALVLLFGGGADATGVTVDNRPTPPPSGSVQP